MSTGARWIVQNGWLALAQQCVSTLPAPAPTLVRSAQASAHLIVSAGVGGSTAFFFIQAASDSADAPEPAFAHDFLRFASFKDRGIAIITQAAEAGAPGLFHTQALVDRLLSTLDQEQHPQVGQQLLLTRAAWIADLSPDRFSSFRPELRLKRPSSRRCLRLAGSRTSKMSATSTPGNRSPARTPSNPSADCCSRGQVTAGSKPSKLRAADVMARIENPWCPQALLQLGQSRWTQE